MRYQSMRRFVLKRYKDETGVSGTGEVAEGVIFWNGHVAMCWRTHITSTVLYNSIADCQAVHGHGGSTELEYLDPA